MCHDEHVFILGKVMDFFNFRLYGWMFTETFWVNCKAKRGQSGSPGERCATLLPSVPESRAPFRERDSWTLRKWWCIGPLCSLWLHSFILVSLLCFAACSRVSSRNRWWLNCPSFWILSFFTSFLPWVKILHRVRGDAHFSSACDVTANTLWLNRQ